MESATGEVGVEVTSVENRVRREMNKNRPGGCRGLMDRPDECGHVCRDGA